MASAAATATLLLAGQAINTRSSIVNCNVIFVRQKCTIDHCKRECDESDDWDHRQHYANPRD